MAGFGFGKVLCGFGTRRRRHAAAPAVRQPARRFAVLAFACAACVTAPPHPYLIAPGNEGAPGVQSVLLLPLNFAVALPAELSDGAPRVEESIATYLRSSGRTVASMSLFDALREWGIAADEVRSDSNADPEFKAVTQRFARNVGGIGDFDVLVMPSLLYREARIYEGSRVAVWDGVKREFEFARESRMSGSIHLMTTVAGSMPGVSLHLLVLDSAGTRVFNSFGGVDLVHEFDMANAGHRFSTGLPLRKDRLSDDAAIENGVRLAFDPYLAPIEVAQDSTP
jgi:hypothetical protein